MKEKSKIKRLVIEMRGRTVELSMAEAKELFESLEEVFGKEVIHQWSYKPYWDWYRPYYGSLSSRTIPAKFENDNTYLGGFTTGAGTSVSAPVGGVMKMSLSAR